MIAPAPLHLYVSGLKSHDLEKIAASFAPGILFVTPARTMEHDEILAFLSALYLGFPDWSYLHHAPVHHGGDRFSIRWRQRGTHTGTLTFPGCDPCPATGTRVTIPEHDFHYRVTDSGLTEIRPDPIPGGAPRGIFEQIGIPQPPL